MKSSRSILAVALVAGSVAAAPGVRADRQKPRCHDVNADLVEDPGGSAACPAAHPGCFVGKINGHRLHADALFFAEGIATAPPQSPDMRSYSGITTYTSERGTLTTRDTGLFSTVFVKDQVGLSMAFAQITGGTGEFEGASGYFFANGFIDDFGHEESKITGQLCIP